MKRLLPKAATPAAGLLLTASMALAQSLPPPTRTVYKCQEGGRTYYADAPCLGAKRIDVTPTRGLDKSSGQQRQGADVQRERLREQYAEAFRPVTGLDAGQIEQIAKRSKLTPEAQQACRQLDAALPPAEQAEHQATTTAERQAAQRRLFQLRQQFHSWKCEG